MSLVRQLSEEVACLDNEVVSSWDEESQLFLDKFQVFFEENLPIPRFSPTISTGLSFVTPSMWKTLINRQQVCQSSNLSSSSLNEPSNALDIFLPTYNTLFDFQAAWQAAPANSVHTAIVRELYCPQGRERSKHGRHATGAAKLIAFTTVLERYLWAISNQGVPCSEISLPFQLKDGHVPLRPTNQKLSRLYRDGVLYWFHSVKRVLELPKPASLPLETATIYKHSVAGKLFRTVEKSKASAVLHAITANIAECALGLRALAVVSYF